MIFCRASSVAEPGGAQEDAKHKPLSVARQCALVGISRPSLYYRPANDSAAELALIAAIGRQFLDTPSYGSRKITAHLWREGHAVNRKRVRRLMRRIGLQAIWCRPNTSKPHPEHRFHPYLLRGLAIDRHNQVCCADVTYIPMPKGFLYLVSVMDWASRKVLSWRLDNTLHADFCGEALEEALARFGKPKTIRAASSPALRSPACWKPPECASAWMEKAAAWTTSSSSGCRAVIAHRVGRALASALCAWGIGGRSAFRSSYR